MPLSAICHGFQKKGHILKACLGKEKNKSKDKAKSLFGFEALNHCKAQHGSNAIKVVVCIEDAGYALMEVDTGAAVSSMRISRFKRVLPNMPIQETSTILKTATQELVKPAGVVWVQLNEQRKQLPLHLMTEDDFPMLLGRDWMTQITLPWSEIFQVDTINSTRKMNILLEKFPNIFKDEIGKAKSVQEKTEAKRRNRANFL